MINLKCKNAYKQDFVGKKWVETGDKTEYVLIDFYKTNYDLHAIIVNKEGQILNLPTSNIKITDERLWNNQIDDNSNHLLND